MISSLPKLSILIEGQEAPEDFSTSLQNLLIRKELSCASVCQLELLLQGNDWSDLVKAGSQLDIHLIDEGTCLFQGFISSLKYHYMCDGQSSLNLKAYDELFKLTQTQITQAFENTPFHAILGEKTSALGLSQQNHSPPIAIEYDIQHNQSDLDYLQGLSQKWGCYFHLDAQTIQLCHLSGYGSPLSLALGRDLISLEVHINTHTHSRSIQLSAWNPRLVDFRQGNSSDILSSSLDENLSLNTTTTRQISNLVLEEDEQAQLQAQAELEYQNAREAYVTGSTLGNGELQPGKTIEIQGATQAAGKTYTLFQVTHELNLEKGFITNFSTQPNEKKTRKHFLTSTLAVVKAVDDPNNQGRIQVSYPCLNDVTSQWLPVLIPGAGPNKGLCALPTLEDKVYVVFLQGDVSQGIVLGGLFDGSHLPEHGADSGKVQAFSFQSEGGQKVILDDQNQKLLFEDQGGSKVELSPQKMLLQSTVPIEISAPGQGITIKGSTVDFLKG